MRVIFLAEGNKNGGAASWRQHLESSLREHEVKVRTVNALHGSSILRLSRLWNTDIIHCHHVSGTSVMFVIIGYLLNKKIIYTVHGNIREELKTKTGLKKIFWQPLHYLVFMLAHDVTFPSNYLYQQVTPKYKIRGRTHIIFNGIDIQPGFPRVMKKNNGRRLLSMTNFDYPAKAQGIKTLCSAIHEMLEEYPDIKLDVLGDGKELDSYKAELSCDHVVFHGRQAVKPFMQGADVYIHATYLDNLPYAVIEALDSGLVVFGAKIGGIPEILPEDLLFEMDIVCIKNKLDLFFTNADKYRKISSDVSLSGFNTKNISRKFIKLYK